MRKNYARWWIFGSILPLLLAWQGARTPLEDVFARINGEVLDRSQAYETLREATTAIGHRLTASASTASATSNTSPSRWSRGCATR